MMREQDIPDKNIFMMCDNLNKYALTKIPTGFHIRNCKPEELDIWKAFPFDSEKDKIAYYDFMTEYFNNVYQGRIDEFYNRCLFVCEDSTDKPVATCFVWKAYDKINTIHWFKTLKEYEGKGIGRALISYIMSQLDEDDYPIYLHTQPSSFRAIGLYSSIGFKIVTNDYIGNRKNDIYECLPILKQFMTKESFDKLQFTEAPMELEECAKSSNVNQF